MAFKDDFLRALCREREHINETLTDLKEQLAFNRAKLYELEEIIAMAEKMARDKE